MDKTLKDRTRRHRSGFGQKKIADRIPDRKLRWGLISFLAFILLVNLVSPVMEAADPVALAGSSKADGRISFFVSNPPQEWKELSLQIGSDLEKDVEAELMSDKQTAIYTIYLVDASISESDDRDKCRELLNELVDHRLDQERISIGLAKDNYESLQAFSQDEHTLKEAIRSINFNQDAVKPLGALYEALEKLDQVKAEDGGLGRIIYLSNSTDSASSQKNLSAVKKLIKAQGSQVYTVAYSYLTGDATTEKELKDLAEKSHALYFNLEEVELSEISSSLAKANDYLVASRDLSAELQDGSDKKVRLSIETDQEVIRLEDELTMPFGEGNIKDAKTEEAEDAEDTDETTDEDASEDTDDNDLAEDSEDSADKADSETAEDEDTADKDAADETETEEASKGFSAWLKSNWLIALIVVLVIIVAIILGALITSKRRVNKTQSQAEQVEPQSPSFPVKPAGPSGPVPFTSPVPPTPPVAPATPPTPPMAPPTPPSPASPLPEAPQPAPFAPPVLDTPPAPESFARAAQPWPGGQPNAEIDLNDELWEEATSVDLEARELGRPEDNAKLEAQFYNEFDDEKTVADMDLDQALDKTFVVPQAYLKLPLVRLCDAENPELYVEAPIEKELLIGRSLQSEQGLEIPNTMGQTNNRRKSIGRKHCLLTRDDGRYFVEDLNSTNGTYLNGQRLLEKAEIKAGDKLTLGLMDLLFQVKEPQL